MTMSSNGIRFSITDLSPPTTRVLPTLYQYRSSISLYDAQYCDDGTRRPISESVTQKVIAAILHFQIYCSDFGVPAQNIRILATEAVRTAINSAAFRESIAKATNLHVEMLSKELEGVIGAWGIASSTSDLRGLVMDLGGGSTQITWMTMHQGKVRLSEQGAISFPYGAAALSRRLAELKKGKSKDEAKKAVEELREEIEDNFRNAYDRLKIPPDLIADAKTNNGHRLYLSGGGFRGWGYLLLFQNQVHGHNYPISIVNGFTAHKDAFQDTEAVQRAAKSAHKIFRVSDRRRKQVPAVAFLVNALANALPYGIKEAQFCQGGVREGALFHDLPRSIRAQDPLEVATSPLRETCAPQLTALLRDALPENKVTSSFETESDWDDWSTDGADTIPSSIDAHVICAMANMFYVHASMSKDSASASALQSTNTGILASVHGVSHLDRALLALMLEARYEGELPPREYRLKAALRQLLTAEEAWWAEYLGRVGLVLSRLFPAGHIHADSHDAISCRSLGSHRILRMSASWTDTLGKGKDQRGIRLTFWLGYRVGSYDDDPMKLKETLLQHVKVIRAMGKKKNWIGGKAGWGLKVEVIVRTFKY